MLSLSVSDGLGVFTAMHSPKSYSLKQRALMGLANHHISAFQDSALEGYCALLSISMSQFAIIGRLLFDFCSCPSWLGDGSEDLGGARQS